MNPARSTTRHDATFHGSTSASSALTPGCAAPRARSGRRPERRAPLRAARTSSTDTEKTLAAESRREGADALFERRIEARDRHRSPPSARARAALARALGVRRRHRDLRDVRSRLASTTVGRSGTQRRRNHVVAERRLVVAACTTQLGAAARRGARPLRGCRDELRQDDVPAGLVVVAHPAARAASSIALLEVDGVPSPSA